MRKIFRKVGSILAESLGVCEMQDCPLCRFPIGVIAGSKEAICGNCGYKDPCCE